MNFCSFINEIKEEKKMSLEIQQDQKENEKKEVVCEKVEMH